MERERGLPAERFQQSGGASVCAEFLDVVDYQRHVLCQPFLHRSTEERGYRVSLLTVVGGDHARCGKVGLVRELLNTLAEGLHDSSGENRERTVGRVDRVTGRFVCLRPRGEERRLAEAGFGDDSRQAPGEPFVELQIALRDKAEIPRTFLFGYTYSAGGEWVGYIPTIRAAASCSTNCRRSSKRSSGRWALKRRSLACARRLIASGP